MPPATWRQSPNGSGRHSVREPFGQPDAGRLLALAAADPSHAYLLYGPRGSGKVDAAHAFVAAVLETDQHRVDIEQHPDLYVVEPEGEAILIDQIRDLRGDLHLRPFEAPRRAYLIREAETMGRDAANALLKSLEEPPDYAVFVLVCHDRARLLPTIDSRCQHIRFRTPSTAAIAQALGGGDDADHVARIARGDLDVARRLHADSGARQRFERAFDLARDAAIDEGFDAADAAAEVMTTARAAGAAAAAQVEAETAAAVERVGGGKESKREQSRVQKVGVQRAKRRRRRSETDEVRAVVDAVTGYWRDVLVAAVGAPDAVVSCDRLPEIALLAERFGEEGASVVLSHAREVRRSLELPVTPSLALERLFHSVALGVRGTLIL